jgi:hypothetical protein
MPLSPGTRIGPYEITGAIGAAIKVLPAEFAADGISIANYDVTPEGRFVMLRRGPNGGKLRAVVHWAEELKQILASGAGGVR